MQNQKISYIYAFSAVLLWSSVATAFKISLSFLTPLQLLFFSSLVSWAVLGILATFTKEMRFLKKLKTSQIVKMLALGAINPAMYYLILFKAYDILPAQEAQALNYTWALTLAYLWAFILKQPLKWQDVISGIICYVGVFIIATRGDIFSFHFSDAYGVFLAILSTILWALYWIFNAKWTLHPTLGLFLNFTSGTVLVSFIMLFSGGFEGVELKGVLGATYVGIFEMGVTFFLWLQALRYAKNSSKIANLIFLSPFLSLIFISFFLKEEIQPSTLFGLVFIIFGLIFQQKAKDKIKKV